MSTTPYNTSKWRSLPRDGVCAVGELLGAECEGKLALHHVHPLSAGGDDFGQTVLVCARHHPMLEALARRVYGQQEWKTCKHHHTSRASREACERRLNGVT